VKRALVGILLFWIAVYLFFAYRNPNPAPARQRRTPPATQAGSHPNPPPQPEGVTPQRNGGLAPTTPEEPEIVTDANAKHGKPVLHYRIEHGLMIVQGDQVAGAPTREDIPPNGLVRMDPVKLWPKGNLPYYIQPDVENPDRILQAVAMFDGTAVHLTPYHNEDDVLVFEQAEKDCLSYVGKMVGKQPIWISPECKPDDIAHEILHALGFVHEQNRADRDSYIAVNFDNIDERYLDNFAKLPRDFMRVSGLGPFDFQSLMMYPQWMFAKNGQSTMEPLQRDKLIAPSSSLSPGDIDRLNRAYGLGK
jgi:hypothetical protein